ncbi:MAG: FISUMP domain-containing protein [Candidatus Saccharibacteria bacterium]|nr:FISUMP domain-containing protein [Candidatus Saccharibacteria bacterium]
MDIQSFFRKRRLDFSFSNKSRLKLKREDIAGTTFGEMLHQQTDSYKNTSLDKVIGSLKSIKNLHNLRIAAMTSAFVFFLLALDFAFPLVISDNTVEGVGTVSNTSLTLTTDHEQAKLNIVPTSTSGSFATSTDAEKAKFSVSTTNSTGYTLSIKGSTNNDLSNSAAGDNLGSITTSASGIDAATFNTNTRYLNKWGYMPSKYNGQDNTTKYYGITSSDVTLNETSAPNASGTSDSYSIGLGAKVDYNKPAGSYTNTFILAAVGKPVPYTINYRDGTGDSSVTGLPYADDNHTSSSTSVQVNYGTTSTITRTGYTFANKWCLGSVANSGTTCDGTVYNNGSSIDFIDQTSSSSVVTLYAMWVPATRSLSITFDGDGINSVQVRTASGTGGELKGTVSTSGGSVSGLTYNTAYYLYPVFQSGYGLDNWTKTSPTGTLSSTTELNPTFTIGAEDGAVTIKAKDTRPYMQNFDLAQCKNLATNNDYTLYDSRDGEDYTVRYLNFNCWMTQNLNFSGTTLTPEDSNVDQNVYFRYPDAYKEFGEDDCKTNSAPCIKSGQDSGGNPSVWYNMSAASALSARYDMPLNWRERSQSVCPKGWRLPSRAEYVSLATEDWNSFREIDNGFYKDGDSYLEDHDFGFWWTSTASGSTSTYLASPDRYTVGLGIREFDNRSGVTVRCVLDVDPPNMQDYNSQELATGSTRVLRDSRDGQHYVATRLKDDQVWMADNLNFGDIDRYPLLIEQLDDTNTNIDVDDGDNPISSVIFGAWKKEDGSAVSAYDRGSYISGRDNLIYPDYDKYSGSSSTLYNYYAASAANSIYSDICPKGWELPGDRDYDNLVSAYNSIEFKLWASTQDGGAAFTLPGAFFESSYSNGSITSSNEEAWYWTRTPKDTNTMYTYHFTKTAVARIDRNKRRGNAIRCIRDPRI